MFSHKKKLLKIFSKSILFKLFDSIIIFLDLMTTICCLLSKVVTSSNIFCCHASYDRIGASYPQATVQTATRFPKRKEKNNNNTTMSHSNYHFPGGNGSCTYKMVSFQQHSFACWQIFGKIYITNLLLLVFYRLGQPIGLVPALHYITIFTPYKPI